MATIRTIDCDSVEDFWRLMSPVGELFGSGQDFLFRGQRLAHWDARPSVFRDSVEMFLRTHRLVGMMVNHPTQTYTEVYPLVRFVDACDLQGLRIPGDSPALRDLLYATMKRHGDNNEQWPDAELIPLMALAQHHGVPTRLLDVSSNPFVASYFAASDAVAHHHAQKTEWNKLSAERLAVYGFDMRALDTVKELTRVRVAGSTSPNVRAQAGSFLLLSHHGTFGERYEGGVSVEGKLEGIPSQPDTSPFIVKVTLPVFLSVELLHFCRRHLISASTLFPGYDGAARDVVELLYQEHFASRYAHMKPELPT